MKFLPFVFVGLAAMIIALLSNPGSSGLEDFDPDGSLFNASLDDAFETAFARSLQQEVGELQNTVVHFSDRNCWCETFAEEHIESVMALAQSHDLRPVVVDKLDVQAELAGQIPSYPALAIFDGEQKLVYLGPYSDGVNCAPENGLVEPFIRGQRRYLGYATVLTDTQGCYCNS